ncbi:hypothetical protein ACFQ0B_74315 [Nonomuraea thailandensis]
MNVRNPITGQSDRPLAPIPPDRLAAVAAGLRERAPRGSTPIAARSWPASGPRWPTTTPCSPPWWPTPAGWGSRSWNAGSWPG